MAQQYFWLVVTYRIQEKTAKNNSHHETYVTLSTEYPSTKGSVTKKAGKSIMTLSLLAVGSSSFWVETGGGTGVV